MSPEAGNDISGPSDSGPGEAGLRAGEEPEDLTAEADDIPTDLAAIGNLPGTEDVLRKFATLGAQQAFQIDPAILKQVLVPMRGLEVGINSPAQEVFKWLSPALLESLRLAPLEGPDSFWKSITLTSRFLRDSASVESLYSAAQLAAAAGSEPTSKPRASRTPEVFFSEHVVEICDVRSLLKALSAVQTKHHLHRPVWRGQQDAAWAVHSSLHRQLEQSAKVDEDRLIAAEIATLDSGREWGKRVRRPVEFFAKLQHHGAPTRLLDATVDPEIATWFAVEAHPTLDEVDGLVLGWGRAPRRQSGISESDASVPDGDGVPFWHAWTDNEQRRRVDWGTGTKTWAWFPPALSDRMRAQRAGFLLEAGPILTKDVESIFSNALSQDWRASEIVRATSIVGLPSRHDVLTKPNDANLVPLFAFRILARAKRDIREYLKLKGLTYSSVYPDIGGLVQHLRGPYGPR
ncbi:FRG domain-containing protein [Agromyces atrinae]|uniref:FRG domain-containing protein n=1 Tax=Agromyces atrinae TaxID=592376 RepID=A0A4Q2M973_9MICO|nr:FRG domain-containing protein [Agromyces atrinae]NYD68279.1 hypothetical protein [Agromyces atrinae]RXZ85660.1 FRG domain-containing protein [Agromyces atrinae]